MTDSGQPTRLGGQSDPDGGPPPVDGKAGPRIALANEFASVVVELDLRANGPRLRIVNLGNGRSAFLDPLELASLTWLTHDDLGPFLDPSQTGWGNNGVVPTQEGDAE